MKKFELNKFEFWVKLIAKFSRFAMWFCVVLVIICLLTAVGFSNLSVQQMIVQNIDSITVSLGNVSFDIPYSVLGNNYYLNFPVNILVTASFGVGVIGYLCYRIRKLMLCLLDKKPFSTECVSNLKSVGYFLIISGILMNIIGAINQYYIFEMYNLELVLTSSDSISNVVNNISIVDFNYIIFGIIIYVLAKIFEYGVYLQEEVDGMI